MIKDDFSKGDRFFVDSKKKKLKKSIVYERIMSRLWHKAQKPSLKADFKYLEDGEKNGLSSFTHYHFIYTKNIPQHIRTKFEFWWILAKIYHESKMIYITLTLC